ncbi:hypothetical protein SKAU_G00255640 [Synaphobranchus kaupii]|uniref:XK-related protein n=1 Tax=Synaphobranchus kaupii TaxID=118154 RepID=A0A9Q1IQ79_SYNKA|nr:hypothetical protein SKAU_G00255640 [Synaphobranchus kaupii]
MKLPISIFVSVSLFTAETTAALYLSFTYGSTGDRIYRGFTLLFTLLPSVLVQLTLTFIHRDLQKDRPFVLLLHILQLGPIVRCLEAFYIYGSMGNVEEPYVSIIRKKRMPRGAAPSEEVEEELGRAEGKILTHRAAFARAAVVQAFMGSAPQLTLQVYISLLHRAVPIRRGTMMIVSMLSVVYGALRCNILAMKIKYDDYEVEVRPAAFLCMLVWRSLEISARVAVLVLVGSTLQLWVLPVVLADLLASSLHPWVGLWLSGAPLPVGTGAAPWLLTLLYGAVSVFCWPATGLDLAHSGLISREENWRHPVAYYALHFAENVTLVLLWLAFQTDIHQPLLAALLGLQLLVGYAASLIFMLVLYRFCHPCRKLYLSHGACEPHSNP